MIIELTKEELLLMHEIDDTMSSEEDETDDIIVAQHITHGVDIKRHGG